MDPLTVYRDLADLFERDNQLAMRDRFLILAADASMQSGDPGEAEQYRQRLLQTSRYHMLRPYGSFAEATQAPDVQTYLRDLRANYPVEVAAQLLESMKKGDSRPVDQTQPVVGHTSLLNTPAVASPDRQHQQQSIPATAPVVDVYGQKSQGQRPTWTPPGTNSPPGLDATPAPIPFKPAAQPVPNRIPTTRAIPSSPSPSPQQAARSAPAKSQPPASAPAPRGWRSEQTSPTPNKPAPAESGGWTGTLLGVVTVLVGLALAAFTFARPFLPDKLLP